MPPPQVRAVTPVVVQAPLQVMLQVPAEQTTREPAPTVCVQDFPLQVTLQSGPQVPVHSAPAAQLRRQPSVLALHASNAQVVFSGQSHEVPAQIVETQPVETSMKRTAASAAKRRIGWFLSVYE